MNAVASKGKIIDSTEEQFRIIAWLCWVPNSIFAEIFLRFFDKPVKVDASDAGNQFKI